MSRENRRAALQSLRYEGVVETAGKRGAIGVAAERPGNTNEDFGWRSVRRKAALPIRHPDPPADTKIYEGGMSAMDDAMRERLRSRISEMWPSGMAVSEMARALSAEFQSTVSKNMVNGIVHRAGLEARPSPIRTASAWRPKKPKAVLAPKKSGWHKTQKSSNGGVKVKPQKIDMDSIPTPNAVGFEGLKGGMCRWPVGDPRDNMRYCGESAAPGKPYCEAHCRIAYQQKGA